ncbi:MAG: spore protease YyaC [bacterium]|nr:spore protease YyaC [bacterium]
MKLLEHFVIRQGREVYYYDTVREFCHEDFAKRLRSMIEEEKAKSGKKGVVFLCIGTDRSTGDSLGPLIGYKLHGERLSHMQILGTLEKPVHAMNLEEYQNILQSMYQNHVVIAVDASVGSLDHVGFVTLGRGPLKPGLGVCKELKAVGDLFITGIVGSCSAYDPLMLQSIRLSVVMRLADCISESIFLVDKFLNETTFV